MLRLLVPSFLTGAVLIPAVVLASPLSAWRSPSRLSEVAPVSAPAAPVASVPVVPAVQPVSTISGDPTTDYARAAYRTNLVACVSHRPSCDEAGLSQPDRDYLSYEQRGQRFSPAVVQQVVDARMTIYGHDIPIVQGKATGQRYPVREAEAAPVAQQASAGPDLLKALGLGKEIAGVGSQLMQGLAAAQQQ